MKQLFTELGHLSGGESLRRALTDQLIVEMVRHSVAEESYLYPVAIDRLPGGDRLTDRALADHYQIEDILRRLEAPDIPDDEFALLLSWLINDTRRHLDEEEERIFPLLAERISEEELIELGKKAQRSKAQAPSRVSHKVDGRPLLQLILESGAGLVQRARDHLCGRDRPYPDMDWSDRTGKGTGR